MVVVVVGYCFTHCMLSPHILSILDEESAMKAIWLRGVDCSLSDNSFTGECDIGTIGYGECRGSDLAAVRCGGESLCTISEDDVMCSCSYRTQYACMASLS